MILSERAAQVELTEQRITPKAVNIKTAIAFIQAHKFGGVQSTGRCAMDGAIIANSATVLKTSTNSAANIPASTTETEPTQAQVSERRSQGLEERSPEKTLANLDAAMAMPGDPVPLPTRRPAQTSNDEANWTTLTSVNLRERPTRSARAIGVVAKDAKLRVIARKNRWVQVTNLATSEKVGSTLVMLPPPLI
jgi:Bacterial SH3 domain